MNPPSLPKRIFKIVGWFFLVIFTLEFTPSSKAAQFIFINGDGPGEGLNDPTIVAPENSNPATTRGAQRLAALQRVGQIWGSFLVSNVTIRVEVEFNPLGATTLAAAGPLDIQQNFANAPKPDIWYSIALANSLAGFDLEPASNDIVVTASSDADFYYGFDSITPPGKTNFIDVLLHEMGHGLGFISYVNLTNGTFPLGQPDTFSALIFDQARNAAWPVLTPAQRVLSSRSEPNLIWNGPFTTAGGPQVLALATGPDAMALAATLPGPVIRPLTYQNSTFGEAIPASGLTGQLRITQDGTLPPGDPTGACQALVNGPTIAGNIAFIRRGICDFDDKAFRAQQAGAVAVILADNVVGNLIIPSGDGVVNGIPQAITIPVIFISKVDGDALLAASPNVTISFTPLPTKRAGTTAGRLRLYAPPETSAGSSVSHWSESASPNLLMEPFISPNLDRKLDLTLTQMKDIGWKMIDIPFPYLTYESWLTTVFPAGAPATGPQEDPDRDGIDNFEEYFFGTQPTVADLQNLPVFTLTSGQPELIFIRSKLTTDLSYSIEKSTNLAQFTPAVAGVDYQILSTASLGSDTERVRLRVPASPAKLFLRIRISR